MLEKLVNSDYVPVTRLMADIALHLTSLPDSRAAAAAATQLDTYGGAPWRGLDFWPHVERVLDGLAMGKNVRLRIGTCLVYTAIEAGGVD